MADAIRSAACCCFATERACRRLASGSAPRAGRAAADDAGGRAVRAVSVLRPLAVLVRGMGGSPI
ncbi:hypothetical protein GCM10025331_41120 [Actinoplanes utahensis]|nr:hypothetical protein Aut01nite_72970 [Actinoplanes utahensis]